MNPVVRIGPLLVILLASSLAQTPQTSDLTAIENTIAKQFNELRQKAGLPPLKIRHDLRVRMEACSIQMKGPDGFVDIPQQGRKLWYLTAEPKKTNDELTRLAKLKTSDGHVGVGAWFAKTPQYPSGMYRVVVYPEHGAAHEVFWSHFYLTDEFEYQTSFGRRWKQNLPSQCKSIQ